MVTETAGSVFRENLFYRETSVQDDGGRHVAKRSLPRSHSSGTRPSASCGYCCPIAPRSVGTGGKFVLSSPSG